MGAPSAIRHEGAPFRQLPTELVGMNGTKLVGRLGFIRHSRVWRRMLCDWDHAGEQGESDSGTSCAEKHELDAGEV